MAEAKDDSTPKRLPVTLSVAEVHKLCGRLQSRAQSFLLRDEPEQARDIAMAGAVILALLKNVNHADIVMLANGT
jgi:hypothetical protein